MGYLEEHSADVARCSHRQSRVVVSGALPAGSGRFDRGQVEDDIGRTRWEVLLADSGRPNTSQKRKRLLAAFLASGKRHFKGDMTMIGKILRQLRYMFKRQRSESDL